MNISECELRINPNVWGAQDKMQPVTNEPNCIPNAWHIYIEKGGEKGTAHTHTHTGENEEIHRDRPHKRTIDPVPYGFLLNGVLPLWFCHLS